MTTAMDNTTQPHQQVSAPPVFSPSVVASKVKKSAHLQDNVPIAQRPAKKMTHTPEIPADEDEDTWTRTEDDDIYIMPFYKKDSSSRKTSGEGVTSSGRNIERSSTGHASSSGHGDLYVIAEQKQTSRGKPKPKSAPTFEIRKPTTVAMHGYKRQVPVAREERHDVNTNYTFSLRRSVGGAIPKYLQHHEGAEGKAAMMHMFNVIRTAMADDNVECMVADVLGVKTTAPRVMKGTGGDKTVERQTTREKIVQGPPRASAKGSGNQQRSDGGRSSPRSFGGQNDVSPPHRQMTEFGPYGLERHSSCNMDEPYIFERGYKKPPTVISQKPKVTIATNNCEVGKQQRTTEVGKQQRTTRSADSSNSHDNTPGSISRFIQKGSPKDAMYTMADYIEMERYPKDGQFGREDFEVISTSNKPSDGQRGILKNQNLDFDYGVKGTPPGKTSTKPVGDPTMRYDSSMAFSVRRRLRHAIPKFTSNNVTGALLQLSEKLMDEFHLDTDSSAMTNMNACQQQDKNSGQAASNTGTISEDTPWVSKGSCAKENKPQTKRENTSALTTGKSASSKTNPNDSHYGAATTGNRMVNSPGKATQNPPWVSKGEAVTTPARRDYSDSSYDKPWAVTKGNAACRITAGAASSGAPARAYNQPGTSSVYTQTSQRALCNDHVVQPRTITAKRGWNKNSNQSASSLSVSLYPEGSSIQEADVTGEIFYDAVTTLDNFQIKSDQPTDNNNNDIMSKSFLKRFRLNLLFRKKKHNEQKFVSVVGKVIEARRSGCIDEDGNFVQNFTGKKDDSSVKQTELGKKSPPPQVKPKPKQKLDKNGNQRVSSSKKRGSSKRRLHQQQHNADRNSYPLPEEDDGSEGYASASEMDDFNPTAFLERNRRSAENRFYRSDDGDEADVESDSDGNNSTNRRVRFSDDVQHFGEIEGLGDPNAGSTDTLDIDIEEDNSPDISLLSLKSKIQLFEKVSSNEFLDERSYQGSPPPADLPDSAASLPTKDRVQLFEDISCGKKPTTCAKTNKTPRRAVESCQYTLTQSKISFFEQLSDPNKRKDDADDDLL